MSITQAAAKNHQRQVASSTPESQATINVASGVARALGQGLTFGFADEAEAYLRSVVGNREYKEVMKLRFSKEGSLLLQVQYE